MNGGARIGFWTCTALVVGNVIGLGIFILPASLAPYGLNAMLGWLVTLVGCLALARVFAHLSHALPGADGPYGYIRHTLGDLPAYMASWSYWVSIWLTNAALATGAVAYLQVIVPGLRQLSPALLALALLWLFIAVNLLGVRMGGTVQVITSALKLLPMLGIALLGAWIGLSTPQAYTAHLPVTPLTPGNVTAAATIALFAMLGLESASVPASRVNNPARTIPRATMAGTLLAAIVYIIVSAVPMLLIPSAELANTNAPFALVMDRYLGAGVGRWLSLFVVVSGLGCLNGWTLLSGEITRTMAGNGVLPAVLARENRRGAPAVALIVTGVLASIMVWMSYSKSLVAAFTFITRVVTNANLPLYLCCSLALLVLWRRGEEPGAGGQALLFGLLGTAFAVFAFIGSGREPFLLALCLIAVGLPLYGAMRWRQPATPPAKARG